MNMQHSKSTREFFLAVLILLIVPAFSFTGSQYVWEKTETPRFTIHFTGHDKPEINTYIAMMEPGMIGIETFFKNPYRQKFDVHVFPQRIMLDQQWQKDWNMPEFKSQCWMVASGLATRFDMVSPLTWAGEKCEHDYSDRKKTQQLFMHELVHVYHGQYNVSPDFTNVEGIDWFIEGLATYVSGQCDSIRMIAVKKAILNHTAPDSLDKFWPGKLSYGLSGSMMMYIDYKYGREMLMSLLPLNKRTEILAKLNTDEANLISGWRDFVLKK